MTDALWSRLSTLVPDALERAPGERGAFLDAACTTGGVLDAELRAEAAALVAAADDQATETLRPPFADLAAEVAEALPPAMRPDHVGPWRLGGVLGEGGMGTVYRAARDDGAFDRTVALKLLRGTAHAARLDAERRVLARLEHDGIARLYDGGTLADGRPYLVMELVDGGRLTDAAARLPLGARLGLMLQVCDAVAFAHRHLVVHRDLKPSNILVTDDGRAKLLDFGIAHLVGDDAGLTRTGEAALTPAYAAPEQLLRQPVTTATDVYALGVLLYEVLAGQRPYDLSTLTASQAERVVCHETPPPPSRVAPPDAARALRGDLDTVVMAALDKDPARRYASAAALADDLRRVRDARPPVARPATRAHRARLFVRRNRTAALAAAAVALTVLAGSGVALWQAAEARAERDRAQARFDIARGAARALLYDVHDAVSSLSGSTEARELVLAQSADYLDRLAASAADDLALRVDLANAYTRVGSVQGLPTGSHLGRTPDAERSFRRGLAVLGDGRALAADDTLAQRAARVRARLLQSLGVLLAHDGRLDSALVLLRTAEAGYGRLGTVAPGDLAARLGHAEALIDLGDHLGHPHFPNAGRRDEAGDHYARAGEVLASVAESSDEAARKLSVVAERQGTLRYAAGDYDGALERYRASLRIRERLAAAPDASYDARRDGGIAHEVIGRTLRRQGRLGDALAAYRRALAVYQALAREDPANVGAQRTLAIGHWQLAAVLAGPEGPNLGRRAEARAELDRALGILRALAADNASAADLVADVEADRRALG